MRFPTLVLVRIAIVATALSLSLGGSAAMVSAQPTSQQATVTATQSLVIRDCPLLQCTVVGKVVLGDVLNVTGDADNGFLPVEWNGTVGFAYRLYLDSGQGAPWFVEGTASCKQVALVFDIGIGYEPSASVLETLQATDTPATMFPMGWWAPTHPDYLRQLDRAGFEIGTHGNEQIFLTEHSSEAIAADVTGSIAAIESVIGREVDDYFTPYAGDTNEQVRQVVAGLGLMPVGWNVAANDYGPDATEASVYERVMSSVYPGAIVEMHLDGPATETSTALALPRIIADLEAQGYTFVPISGLIIPCDGVTPS